MDTATLPVLRFAGGSRGGSSGDRLRVCCFGGDSSSASITRGWASIFMWGKWEANHKFILLESIACDLCRTGCRGLPGAAGLAAEVDNDGVDRGRGCRPGCLPGRHARRIPRTAPGNGQGMDCPSPRRRMVHVGGGLPAAFQGRAGVLRVLQDRHGPHPPELFVRTPPPPLPTPEPPIPPTPGRARSLSFSLSSPDDGGPRHLLYVPLL